MTIYRATVMDVAGDPFIDDAAFQADSDGGVLVNDGVIHARGAFESIRSQHPDEVVVDLSGGILVPGFVDTHVHYPQMRAMGGLGRPLLEWLEHHALPEECRLADHAYAAVVADEFLDGLLQAGTTSALVFGSHFAPAMDELFEGAQRRGLNVTSGLVLSDRILPDALLSTPARALTESRDLIARWHGVGRLRYAVTPRFSVSASDELLEVCGELLGPDVWFTSHSNENLDEVAVVAELFASTGARDYLDTYRRHGLLTERSVLAHNVHISDAELDLMASVGAWSAHCPTSNSALGSGLFPLARHHAHGVGVALGSDVGAGTGLYLPKEGLQAYFMQQLLGASGLPLTPAHLLYLCTRAGALAMGIANRVGDFSIGKEFDAVLWRPVDDSELAINLAHADDPTDALARIFALGTSADVAAVWLRGEPVRS